MVRLKYVCSLYCLCGVMDVMVGALRGLGYSVLHRAPSLYGNVPYFIICEYRFLV